MFAALDEALSFLQATQPLNSLKGGDWSLLRSIGVDVEKGAMALSEHSKTLYEGVSALLNELHSFVRREVIFHATLRRKIANEGEQSMWLGRGLMVYTSLRLIQSIRGKWTPHIFPVELVDFLDIARNTGYPESITINLHMLLKSINVNAASEAPLRSTSVEQYQYYTMYYNRFG
tara:strand:- start:2047 stop:2571 length:525 start_codon:yes stop_codon:yes gene_type:complete